MSTASDQAAIYNTLSKIVLWGFLASIFVVIVSGYFIPWSAGRGIDIYGLFTLPSPMNCLTSAPMEQTSRIA